MNIEKEFKELLLPVFGLDSGEEVRSEASLVKDLGADSLDFVEIIHLIERKFGVVIETSEIVMGGADITEDKLFKDGKLTAEGSGLLRKTFSDQPDRFVAGLTKFQLFTLITVQDMINIICAKIAEKGTDYVQQ